MKKLLFLSVSILLSAFMLISCDKSDNADNQSGNITIPMGYFDLGLPSGTLWKSSDESFFYSYDEAIGQFGSQLPTANQWRELRSYCEWTKWNYGGYKVTGPNGKYIVLSTFGSRNCDGIVSYGSEGYYWSSTPLSSDHALGFILCSLGPHMNEYNRCEGFSVRLVLNK